MSNLKHELEQLERVTSRGAPGGAPLNSEEAELREGWLALAQLVEQADEATVFDEQAFLANVSCGGERLSPAPRRDWLVLYAALAASILVCILAGGYMVSQRWGSGKNLAHEEKTAPTKMEQIVKSPLVAEDTQDFEFSWDDALDERIDYFHQSLSSLESGGYAGDRSLQTLGLQLEEFGQQIDGGSL